jgi:hypothetical protein
MSMANEEQLSILKQGVEVWNKWREENPDVEVDLRNADITLTNLAKANFFRANFALANLNGTDLRGADLRKAIFLGAELNRTCLVGAKLNEANLNGANLGVTDLTLADLSRAILSGSTLFRTHFNGTILNGVKFSLAAVDGVDFGNVDLSVATGLESVIHQSPSQVSTNTLVLSKGQIPDIFLQGCGLSDWEIEMAQLYNPELINDERKKILYKIYDPQASQAIQISPLFISYSHADSEFVEKVGDSLTEIGIRYWRDTHNMKAGRMERQIDRAIRQNPTVLLVLSEHSLNSDWVEHEVRSARQLEKEIGRDTLCPVALDDSWKSSRWPKRIMEQIMEYNILDFSEWEDDVKFEGMFRKLIDGLELFYKG